MEIPVGARVGAILSQRRHEVQLLGFGVYDGMHVPPFGPFGASREEYEQLIGEMKASGRMPGDYEWRVPRITLDNGRVVWGNRCWWGPEDVIRRRLAGRAVREARVDEAA